MKNRFLKQFFLQRMTECYNKNTIDSYRVRSNNVITLLYETRDVVIAWNKHRVKKFETVVYVLEETLLAIKRSSCLLFNNCPKEILIEQIEEYKRCGQENNHKTNLFLFYIDSCIEDNNNNYLSNLFSYLKGLIFLEEEISKSNIQQKLNELDCVITELACELIRLGYSKIYLFGYFQDMLKSMTECEYEDFENKFNEIECRYITRDKLKYVVIFILSVPKECSLFDNLIEEVPKDIIDNIDVNRLKSLQSANGRRFYLQEVNALDEIVAIKIVREEISLILDLQQDGSDNKSIRISHNAFVGIKDEKGCLSNFKSKVVYSLDISRSKKIKDFSLLPAAIEMIDNNCMVDNECKSRIKSALRHLRIGDGQLELEQRFINYWIGLEFLFASPEVSDSTFARMKCNLINILTSCYIKRNILNLVDWMKRYGCSTSVFESDQNIDAFAPNVENNILMWYRLKRMKSHLHSSDKTENYIAEHRRNLEQHLSRLYRLRNELLHEGAIKQDIENLTSNLRYYLVFILNLCIGYFCRERMYEVDLTMDSFFWEYNKHLQIFSLNKQRNYKYEYLMNVPLQNEYLR